METTAGRSRNEDLMAPRHGLNLPDLCKYWQQAGKVNLFFFKLYQIFTHKVDRTLDIRIWPITMQAWPHRKLKAKKQGFTSVRFVIWLFRHHKVGNPQLWGIYSLGDDHRAARQRPLTVPSPPQARIRRFGTFLYSSSLARTGKRKKGQGGKSEQWCRHFYAFCWMTV